VTSAVIEHSVRFAAPKPTRLVLSDSELVRYLRMRDGDPPRRSPSHAPQGRCKYERQYPSGGCPWCREKAA
jgi:hypothetical protein